jgi:hypothetical protein
MSSYTREVRRLNPVFMKSRSLLDHEHYLSYRGDFNDETWNNMLFSDRVVVCEVRPQDFTSRELLVIHLRDYWYDHKINNAPKGYNFPNICPLRRDLVKEDILPFGTYTKGKADFERALKIYVNFPNGLQDKK